LVLAALVWGAADKDNANELFRELTAQGIAIGAREKVKLPAPTLADGLDAMGQRAVLEAIAGNDYSVEELVRPSVVAPFVLKYRTIRPSDPDAPAYGIDVWFVAHGDLDTLADKEFLEQWQSGQKDRKVHILTAPELASRKLSEHSAPQHQERYGHATFTVLDRVQMNVTLHAVTTRRADSILGAARVDPRFTGDPDFANLWRPITRDEDGRPMLGSARPYGGAAAYVKITKLLEPAGALLVEYHLLFVEPRDWFGGANLLRSKVPILAQSEVRAFRRELVRARK
jgi:hypothetical protein